MSGIVGVTEVVVVFRNVRRVGIAGTVGMGVKKYMAIWPEQCRLSSGKCGMYRRYEQHGWDSVGLGFPLWLLGNVHIHIIIQVLMHDVC